MGRVLSVLDPFPDTRPHLTTLGELRRVARGPVVILTLDAAALARFWLCDYVPEVVELERARFPAIDRVSAALGGRCSVTPVPVPRDCTDGFGEAYYARPEAFLRPEVLAATSGVVLTDPAVLSRASTTCAATSPPVSGTAATATSAVCCWSWFAASTALAVDTCGAKTPAARRSREPCCRVGRCGGRWKLSCVSTCRSLGSPRRSQSPGTPRTPLSSLKDDGC